MSTAVSALLVQPALAPLAPRQPLPAVLEDGPRRSPPYPWRWAERSLHPFRERATRMLRVETQFARAAFGRLVLAVLGVIAIVLVVGAGVSRAADYQDANGNVCEGTFATPGCSTWGSHVTGSNNIAMGEAMMGHLTSGFGNVAFGTGALGSEARALTTWASATTHCWPTPTVQATWA